MSQYFDKDFFKFLLVFVAIILIGCAVMFGAKIYESNSTAKTPPVSNNEN